MLAATVPTHADVPLATAVKGAYLTKIAPFVTWPERADPSPSFTICLVGNDPFGKSLDASAAGLTMDGRPYQIMRVDNVGPNSTCDMAYISGSPRQTVAGALRALSGTPTLTITDEGSPAGIISFKMQAGKVRFRIDKVAADANGLVLSSKLLSLALSVRTEQGVIEP
ncbi:YfiR family protein [Asticcacaulis taihuensis]|uniref:YfiR family protein n=1 Tax=Asticcacaulis taihuensis TaxID=260084 RepID=UPI0026F1A4B6|nr:YfiR family protein [Asticcacaulis taihuensis]